MEARVQPEAGAREPIRVPTFVVIGGGDVGAIHVRQLLRAAAAGRLSTDRIRVVDRDRCCRVASLPDSRVELNVASWDDWLDSHLARLGPEDHFVPYHWAPHVLVEWLSRQAAREGAVVRPGGTVPIHGLPYERPTAAGDTALSYATWLCPPFCIEPALCPHTRGPKDWSLARDLAGDAQEEALGRLVFRCLHLVYGVGTIPVAAIQAARKRVLEGLRRGPRRYLVATSSHCHALATILSVEPPGPQSFRIPVTRRRATRF